MFSNLFKHGASKAAVDLDLPAESAPDGGNLPEIVMYSTTWCPSCKMAKRYLGDRDIPYQEIDIEAVPGAAAQVQAWAGGYKTVPTFRIGDAVVVDWDRRVLEDALRGAGYSV